MSRSLFLLSLLPSVLSWSCAPDSSELRASQTTGCRTRLWDITVPDPSNNLTNGYSSLTTTAKTEFYDGLAANRTYSHHPLMLNVDGTIVLVHSSAKQDEDSMGQEIWGGVSRDGGLTWTESNVILPSALLPNQTQEYNFTYWWVRSQERTNGGRCELRVPQRAWGPVAVVQGPVTQIVYAVADSSDFFCNDGTLGSSVSFILESFLTQLVYSWSRSHCTIHESHHWSTRWRSMLVVHQRVHIWTSCF